MSKDLSQQLCELCGIPPKCVNCGQTVSDDNPCPKPCNKQKYPDFTPEKQLELIKLIGKKHRAITYIQCSDYCAMQVNPVSRAFGMYYEAESFEEVIVITILELLKVNELDKSEVKRILEDDQLRTHKSHER